MSKHNNNTELRLGIRAKTTCLLSSLNGNHVVNRYKCFQRSNIMLYIPLRRIYFGLLYVVKGALMAFANESHIG